MRTLEGYFQLFTTNSFLINGKQQYLKQPWARKTTTITVKTINISLYEFQTRFQLLSDDLSTILTIT
jgi:hypothetical protein